MRGDGQNLRKLTNAPAHDLLGRFPKGTVTVDVQALASGPFFIIVQGAPEPQLVSSSGRLTFKDVADFGSGVQAVVAATGGSRWTGTPVDVQADRTASAGTLAITPLGGIEGYGAGVPVWRSDGRKVGFLGPLCLPAEVPVDPPPGPSTTPLVAAEAAHGLCAIDRGPTAATAGQLALGTIGFDEQGRTFLYVAPEGATSLPAPVLTLDNFRRLTDLHWLPSGSGLIAAWQDDLTDEDINLHELDLASRQTRQLTDFSFGTDKLRRFTVSPDGGTIVFERTDDLLFGKSDLWIANRDGSGLRKLVADAGFPAWNPAAAPKR